MKLSQVRRIAMSLPAVTEEPHFQYSSFRVHGKIFATVPPEGEYLHIFVPEEQREAALALNPEFLEKLLWGGRVVGVRAILTKAKPRVIAGLLTQAWSQKAPKSLLALANAAPTSA